MKNVFFFANFFPNDGSRGITKKILNQIKSINKLGFSVKYYSGYKETGAFIWNENNEIVAKKEFFISNKKFNSIQRSYILKRLVIDFLSSKELDIDIVYYRWLFFDKLSLELYKKSKTIGAYNILEFHSYPNYSISMAMKIPLFFNSIYQRKCLDYIDRIVVIGNIKKINGRDTICIKNGTDSNLKTHSRIYKNSEERRTIRLLVVGYESRAHGYDRIIKGISNYYKNSRDFNYKIELFIVGTVLEKTKKLIESEHMHDYIMNLGIITGEDLDKIYDLCDIGVGALGSHRYNLNGLSSLKISEYVSRKIPFIYEENDDNKFPYALQVPYNEDPVDINMVINFFEKQNENKNLIEQIEKYSEKLSWENQMKKVFNGIQ